MMAPNNLLKFDVSASKTDWLPITVEVNEGLSQLFEIKITAYSTLMPSTAGQLLQQSGTVTLNTLDSEPRYFNGLITDITPYEVLNRSGIYRYEIVLRPWLFLLDLTQSNKIFNDMTVPEIVLSVMGNCPYMDLEQDAFSSQYSKRSYTVQYQESDFHFISRLLIDAGLSYYFTHTYDDHTLCILEPPQGLLTYPAGPIHFGNSSHYHHSIYKWSHGYTDEPTEFEVQGYNFETPTFEVIGRAGKPSTNPLISRYCEYSEDMQTIAEAEARAQLLAERAAVRADVIKGASHCNLLAPGMTFELIDHPVAEENDSYLVTKVTHRAIDAYYWKELKEHINSNLTITEDVYENTFSGIPAKNTFRPDASYPKPMIDGYHLAKVWGPAGESMWVDEYGRVRVTFSWDLEQTMSCYMRVSQPWAGDSMGMQFLPRVGDEVIVKYLSGDIDHPMIVGSASNGDNTPIYPLPQQASNSGFCTQSLQSNDTTKSNSLQFVDTQGQEALNIHAQRDFNIDVNNNFTIQVGNDQTITVKGDYTSTTVFGDISYGTKSITFQVGPSQIILNEQGVFFNAPAVTILTNNGMEQVQGAARVGDQTQCPQTGHGEGTIHTGSPNVFINGAAVARNGDPIFCEDGSVDTITQGISGLYVNGQQAAALNHYTAHNGVIQTSSPSVMMGGGATSSDVVPTGENANTLCFPSTEVELNESKLEISPFLMSVRGYPYIAKISLTFEAARLRLAQTECVNPLTFDKDGFSAEAGTEAQGMAMDFKVKDENSMLEEPPQLTLYNNYGEYRMELSLAPPNLPGELHFTGRLTKNAPIEHDGWLIIGKTTLEVDVELIPDTPDNSLLSQLSAQPMDIMSIENTLIIDGFSWVSRGLLGVGTAIKNEISAPPRVVAPTGGLRPFDYPMP